MTKIDSSNLELVEIKKYDHGIGCEYEINSKRAIVTKEQDEYVNFFNREESYPLFKRVPYANYYNDIPYGTKIVPVTSPRVSDKCYILTKDSAFDRLIKKEDLSREDLENYVLMKNTLFDDSIEIAKQRLKKGKDSIAMLKILKKTMKTTEIVELIMNQSEESERKVQLTKVKK